MDEASSREDFFSQEPAVCSGSEPEVPWLQLKIFKIKYTLVLYLYSHILMYLLLLVECKSRSGKALEEDLHQTNKSCLRCVGLYIYYHKI